MTSIFFRTNLWLPMVLLGNLIACAKSSSSDGTGPIGGGDPSGSVDTDAGNEGGDLEAGDEGLSPSDPTGLGGNSSLSTAGGLGASEGGNSSASGSGGGDGNGGSPSTGSNDCSANSCDSPNQCSSADGVLNTISGDTSMGMAQTTTGCGSKWLSVRVTEDDHSLIAHPMKVTVTIVSPAATSFDVYLYLDAKMDSPECSSPVAQSPNASIKWGESEFGIANRIDDSRTLLIEVRHTSGSCRSDSSWTLTVTGDQASSNAVRVN